MSSKVNFEMVSSDVECDELESLSVNKKLSGFLFFDAQREFDVKLKFRNTQDGELLSSTGGRGRCSITEELGDGILNTYVFTIKLKLDAESDEIIYRKRFSELEEFFGDFNRTIPYIFIPYFPVKNSKRKFVFKEKWIKKRVADLNNFFEKLLENNLIYQTNIFETLENYKGSNFLKSSFKHIQKKASNLYEDTFGAQDDSLTIFSELNSLYTRLLTLQKLVASIFEDISRQSERSLMLKKFWGTPEIFVITSAVLPLFACDDSGVRKLKLGLQRMCLDITTIRQSFERYLRQVKTKTLGDISEKELDPKDFGIDTSELRPENDEIDIDSSIDNSQEQRERLKLLFTKPQRIPKFVKKELYLVEKQLEGFIKSIEEDLKEILSRYNNLFAQQELSQQQ
jgi:hypothetical protein